MQTYIISVLGLVVLSVLTEIILPAGQTAKYIKSIIAVFIVYVLVNPIVTFIKSDFDLDNYIDTSTIKVNQTLLFNLYEEQIKVKQDDLENKLKEEGYEGVEINLEFEIVEEEIIITKAIINIDNLVLTNSNGNINKYQFIRQTVMSNIAIKEESIVFE
ncbi:MAG: stage III sporulation protein AF [Clostridia bacterium]|nr:stage III sporulation protein AF [Clostridia bacterium]